MNLQLKLFFLLPDLLDMPLKFITSAWESGELVSCGFTRVEVKVTLLYSFYQPNQS